MSEKQLVTARSFIKAFNASLLLRSDHHFENKSHQSDTQHQFLCLGTSLHSSCPATNMGRETWAAATTAAWPKSTGVRAKQGLIVVILLRVLAIWTLTMVCVLGAVMLRSAFSPDPTRRR